MRIVLFIAFVFLFLGSNLSAQSDSTVHVYMGYSMTGLTQPEFRNISRGDAFHVGVSKNGYGFIASISYSPIHENNMNLSTSSISFQLLVNKLGQNLQEGRFYVSFGPLISGRLYGIVTIGARIINELILMGGYSSYYGMHVGFMLVP